MLHTTINSAEKRYKKSKDVKKNIVLSFRTCENGCPKESYFLNLKGVQEKPSKRRNRYVVKQFAKMGKLDEILSPETLKQATEEGVLPPPYVVDYKVPLDLGGSSNVSNMYVVDRNVAELMDVLYWRQIRLEVNAACHDRDQKHQKPPRIIVSFAQLPRLFTQEKFLEYILPHERKGLQKYLNQKATQEAIKNEKVSVQVLPDGSELWRLLAQEMLPSGLRRAIIKVAPRLWVERNRLRGEYIKMRPKIVLASLRRGDFKDLPIATQRQIRTRERVPGYVGRTCHHILPLALGGENEMTNICWLNERVHTLLHQKFISPYETHMHGMVDVPQNLFFEIPIPSDAKIQTYTISRHGAVVLNKLPATEKKASKPQNTH